MIDDEKNTVNIMIGLYCKKNHAATDKLCDDCEVLREYVFKRLDTCKFGNNKGTCGKCKVHCYKPDMRERIIKVMRYSGPAKTPKTSKPGGFLRFPKTIPKKLLTLSELQIL